MSIDFVFEERVAKLLTFSKSEKMNLKVPLNPPWYRSKPYGTIFVVCDVLMGTVFIAEGLDSGILVSLILLVALVYSILLGWFRDSFLMVEVNASDHNCFPSYHTGGTEFQSLKALLSVHKEVRPVDFAFALLEALPKEDTEVVRMEKVNSILLEEIKKQQILKELGL